MSVPVKLRFVFALLVVSAFGLAAPGTLGARLALESAPGFTATLQESDALTATYSVSAPKNVPAAVKAVTAYLVTQGWLAHPSVSEAPAPKPGVVQRLDSFVQGSDLLELRTVKAGQGAVTLDLTLISLGAPPQVAAAPSSAISPGS